MKNSTRRDAVTYVLLLCLAGISTGCVQSMYIGHIDGVTKGRPVTVGIENFTVQVQNVHVADDDNNYYILTASEREGGAYLPDISSDMEIAKYNTTRQYDLRRTPEKFKKVARGLEAIFDSASTRYMYAYKFANKGEYQLSITISTIGGKPLSKDYCIVFDQYVK